MYSNKTEILQELETAFNPNNSYGILALAIHDIKDKQTAKELYNFGANHSFKDTYNHQTKSYTLNFHKNNGKNINYKLLYIYIRDYLKIPKNKKCFSLHKYDITNFIDQELKRHQPKK